MAPNQQPEGDTAAPPTNRSQAGKPSFRPTIRKGCQENDVAEVSRGLREAASNGQKSAALLSWAVARAVDHGQVDIVKYLVEEEGATLNAVSPFLAAHVPSAELFQVLLDHGWDINQNSRDFGTGPGKYLLQHICNNEALVCWCLGHGAKVEGMYTDPYESPPILEMVAASGTIPTFELLRSRGAQLGPRTLHRAIDGAVPGESSRMAMVKYLVDDVGLDVNALDTKEKLPDHWGTPLCYAARWREGSEDTVRFLLERGADPNIKDVYGNHNAFTLAKSNQNYAVVEVLRKWGEEHKGK